MGHMRARPAPVPAAAYVLLLVMAAAAPVPLRAAMPDLANQQPEDVARQLIVDFIKNQTGQPETVRDADNKTIVTNYKIDLSGTSEAWRKYFPRYAPLGYESTSTPFQVDPASRDTRKNGRLASVVCPGREFPYDCDLEASEIRATAAGTTSGGSFQIGAFWKGSALTGSGVWGNDAVSGFTWRIGARRVAAWSSVDADADQVTTTPARRKAIPANSTGCYEIQTLASRHLASGTMQVGAVFSGWIAVKHKDPTAYTSLGSAKHTYYLFDFANVVKLAKAAKLARAREWVMLNGTKPFISYTLNLTMFLATGAESTVSLWPVENDKCTTSYSHPPALAGSGLPAPGLVPAAADVDAAGRRLHRRLLQDAAGPDSGAASAAATGPTAFSVLKDGGSSPQPIEGLLPAAVPTAPEELAARHASAAAAGVQASAPVTLLEKIKGVVQAVCFDESGKDCDVTYDDTSYIWKQYFSTRVPALSLTSGVDALTTDGAPALAATTAVHRCKADNTPGLSTCTLRDQDMHTKAHTETHTTGGSAEVWIGWRVKVKASSGAAGEWDNEFVTDISGSWNSGTTDTDTDGVNSRVTVRVPMQPNKCTTINMTTIMVSAKSFTKAWLCMSGYVATMQSDWTTWKGDPWVDCQAGANYPITYKCQKPSRYRALSLPSVIQYAKEHGFTYSGAFDWHINNRGEACIDRSISLAAETGAITYVFPAMYPDDHPICSRPAEELRPAQAAAAPAPDPVQGAPGAAEPAPPRAVLGDKSIVQDGSRLLDGDLLLTETRSCKSMLDCAPGLSSR